MEICQIDNAGFNIEIELRTGIRRKGKKEGTEKIRNHKLKKLVRLGVTPDDAKPYWRDSGKFEGEQLSNIKSFLVENHPQIWEVTKFSI